MLIEVCEHTMHTCVYLLPEKCPREKALQSWLSVRRRQECKGLCLPENLLRSTGMKANPGLMWLLHAELYVKPQRPSLQRIEWANANNKAVTYASSQPRTGSQAYLQTAGQVAAGWVHGLMSLLLGLGIRLLWSLAAKRSEAFKGPVCGFCFVSEVKIFG